jgi:hypothetical protein
MLCLDGRIRTCEIHYGLPASKTGTLTRLSYAQTEHSRERTDNKGVDDGISPKDNHRLAVVGIWRRR